MQSSMLKAIIVFFLVSISHASESDSDFSKNIDFVHDKDNLALILTGSTIRKKYFLDIYSMAHYVEKKPTALDDNIYKNIMQSAGAKQISMVFMRDLSSDQIQKSLIEGIQLNTTENEYIEIKPQVTEFIASIYNDVQQNDKFIIRWLADGTLVSLFKGKTVSTIKNELFAKTVWSIWFGDKSIVDRDALISQF